MFPIQHVIQFNLEHRGDYVSARLTFDREKIIGQDKPTFAGANLAYSRRGIAKTILWEGVRSRQCAKISILTGKESKAFIVRRNVLGCLSRDRGARGEVSCFMSREKRREQGGRTGGRGGGERGVGGGRERRARGGERGP